ncbi:transposase, partial [Micromonospora echinofusca]|nr:transposase [Micromonospora echinofusca]
PAPVAPAAAVTPPVSAPPSVRPNRPEPALPPAARQVDAPTNRPVSAPPPPPPGMTPITPGQRPSPAPGQRPGVPSGQRPGIPPAEAGEPFRPTLTTAAINNARAERQRPTVISPRPKTNVEAAPPAGGFSVTDRNVPVPAPRPEPEHAPPGSRANWPLVNPSDDRADTTAGQGGGYARSDRESRGGRSVDAPTVVTPGEGRVTPPWLADDLPPEPPSLRLVEPAPPADRSLRDTADRDTPPLRLVDREEEARTQRSARPERPKAEHRPPPVADEGDGDLLIFAAARSAWFTDQPAEEDAPWSFTADTGWRAAEQAARPAVGAETPAGLPKRVPQANLVPGSPLRDERPLRIVRDPASLAENTTGYFRGWRRGQEIGGFAVGGRPGREAAGGWDFSRDPDEREDDREPEYRPAGYRS